VNERDVSEKFVDWIGDVCGIADDAVHRYPYPVANVLGAPPIVAGVVDRKHNAPAEDEELRRYFPALQIQQVEWLRVFDSSATIMVEIEEATKGAAAAEAAARATVQQLQAFGALLEADAWADYTLGGRLGDGFVSPALAFDYSAVFRELDGGARGRVMSIEATIGEPIDLEPE
jgi:hypothetical protein